MPATFPAPRPAASAQRPFGVFPSTPTFNSGTPLSYQPRIPPPFTPRVPPTLTSLPTELLLQITHHLPLPSLHSLLASSRRSFAPLHALTIRSPHFIPWRRRYDAHRRLLSRLFTEAETTAYNKKRSSADVEITSTAAATEKTATEREYEALLAGWLADFGFEDPAGRGRMLELSAARLFSSLQRLWGRDEDTASQAKRRGFLRLKRLPCRTDLLRNKLAGICVPEIILALIPPQYQTVHGDAEPYVMLTAYLLYSSLTPDDVFGIVEGSTPPEMRTEKRAETEAALVEFFCYLALFLDIWDGETDLLERFPGEEEAPPVEEVLFGPSERRLLNARMRDWLEAKFGMPKPLLPEKPVDIGKGPADWGEGSDYGDSGDDDEVWDGLALPGLDLALPVRPKPPDVAQMEYCTSQPSQDILVYPSQYTDTRYLTQSSARTGPFQRSLSDGLTPPHSLPTPQPPAADTLTPEQQRVVDTDLSGGDLLKIRAYAGTGKTRTLVEYAKKRPYKKFLYVAFNKNAQTDARKKFGPNVDCKTMHAVALRCLASSAPVVYAAKEQGRMTIPRGSWGTKEISEFLELDRVKTIISVLAEPAAHNIPADKEARIPRNRIKQTQEGTQSLKPFPTATTVATMVKTVLQRFWNSTDNEIKDYHLPSHNLEKLGLSPPVIKSWAVRMWTDILTGRGAHLPHDAYLKLKAISPSTDLEAFAQYDVIFMDEAQDNNACMADLLLRQRRHGISLIVVGDPYQKIYGFRGAGNDCFDDTKFPATHTAYLTHSFRFGARVAALANTLLRALHEPVPLTGVQPHDSVLRAPTTPTPPHPPTHPTPRFTVIFRRNASLVAYALSFTLQHPTHKLHLQLQRSFRKPTLFHSLRAAYHLLHHGTRASSGPLRDWRSWHDLKTHVDSAEPGDDSPLLALVVELEPALADPLFLAHLDSAEHNVLDDADAARADVVLITAHQAKGLEWERVHVHADFGAEYARRGELAGSRFRREEMHLLYVAVTRARRELVVEGGVVEWVAGERGAGRRWVVAGDPGDLDACERCGRLGDVRIRGSVEGLPALGELTRGAAETRARWDECFWCRETEVRALVEGVGAEVWRERCALAAAWERRERAETARVAEWVARCAEMEE